MRVNFLIVLSALLIIFLMLWVGPASAHHPIPSQKILSKVYPDLAARDAPSPKLRMMLRTRWIKTHPAATQEHRVREARAQREAALFAMFDEVASCESHNTWDISTGNGYYGGLQMDRLFASTYDPVAYAQLGTPNNWSRVQQIRAAIRAYAGRGLAPWPHCGHARLGYRPVR